MTTRQEPVIATTGGRLGAFHGLDLPFVFACRGESVPAGRRIWRDVEF
jgi:hypothetical protein